MRVGLAHDQVVTDPVVFTALIAGYDARRYAGGAHDQREAAGVVLAKAAPGFEQEFVDRVVTQRRGLQRIDILLLTKHL